ncbi:Rne/Rng family ribonuclease [Thermosipho ferrireducens]|uniref:Rne/Rng family ribonuclease n=1 Tax=Thermosipho ferrireducens TaxID=2571116 RepID=A0ABX7S6T6_9BACT|nr:Rne/Rng family ribonuclease [Thermosipho ferrireducens]QTA37613.1 Rne/Rng family ribonuclease [Thermosipho ferrireducens]
MGKILVLNTVFEQLQCAVIESGKLVELFFEENEKLAGNIYLGRLDRAVNALEAVFVNIGESKNGFLRMKDISKAYQDFFKLKKLTPKLKLLVQVKKDPTGSKGAQLTTNISLAGRYVVIFPFSNTKGVSKKIIDEDERERLYNLANTYSEKYKLGIVLRTASEGVDETHIEDEIITLVETWESILSTFKRARKPRLLYSEKSAADYIFKEKLSRDVELIITNLPEHVQIISRYIKGYPKRPKIEIIDGDTFQYAGIYEKSKELFRRRVNLPSGGEIIIDRTEALTVIDVNSKHFVSGENQQETAFRTNLEAAEEICRQLRLRNIGGIIIIDFIDMTSQEAKEAVLNKMKEETTKDKSKIEILGFTKLGLLELTRKRTIRSFDELTGVKCPSCKGYGFVPSPKIIIRELFDKLSEKPENVKEVIIKLHPSLKEYISRKDVKKAVNMEVHIHFTHYNPASFEITWKK